MGEECMSDSTFKKIEVTGTSAESVEDAIQNAIAKAGETESTMYWFETEEIRGRINGTECDQWQVTVKIGCKME
jgi:flavin-binding protein dodecin